MARGQEKPIQMLTWLYANLQSMLIDLTASPLNLFQIIRVKNDSRKVIICFDYFIRTGNKQTSLIFFFQTITPMKQATQIYISDTRKRSHFTKPSSTLQIINSFFLFLLKVFLIFATSKNFYVLMASFTFLPTSLIRSDSLCWTTSILSPATLTASLT